MTEVHKVIKPIKLSLNIFLPVVTVLVPFIIYCGIRFFGIRYLLTGLFFLYLLRSVFYLRKGMKKSQIFIFIIIAALLGLAIVLNRVSLALFTPALINLGLLLSFGSTLVFGPPLIEIFARRQVKSLSEQEVRYCRKLTGLWSLFFIINGSISLITAVAGNMEHWIIYNGFLSYIMIGLFFSIEMTYRYYRFRNYGNTVIDNFYKRIFKPYAADSQG